MTPDEIQAALKQARDERDERIRKMREQAAADIVKRQKLATESTVKP